MAGVGEDCTRRIAAALIAAAVLSAPAAAAEDIGACAGKPYAIFAASGARDGATIRLAGGSEVRIAGVIAPDEMDGAERTARRATQALDALVAGRRIGLHGEKGRDRYGRHVAQVSTEDAAAPWVQLALVGAGGARAAPGLGEPDCSAALIGVERTARAAKAGLWSDRKFAVRQAGAIKTLLADVGRYSIVEGTVRRIGESGGRIYLDFGRRYTEDFTGVIGRAAQRTFADAGVDLRKLAGRSVRVRGVLFSWGGPAIELRSPAALELIGTDER